VERRARHFALGGPARWLFDEVAVDIPFVAEGDVHAIEARLREVRGDLPIDIVVQPEATRRKKLFLADMDSTMIGQECIDELADFAGLKALVSEITEARDARRDRVRAGAARARRAASRVCRSAVVDEVLEKRITLTGGRRELVANHARQRGVDLPDLGRFYPVHHTIAARIGFQENRANELVVERRQVQRRGQGADLWAAPQNWRP